jgi:hypothetical protein
LDFVAVLAFFGISPGKFFSESESTLQKFDTPARIK